MSRVHVVQVRNTRNVMGLEFMSYRQFLRQPNQIPPPVGAATF